MALSEANEVKICQILNITPEELQAQIDWLGATFTTEQQTAIEAQILLWDTASLKTTKIHPRERNYGVETRPDTVLNNIRQKIAILLRRDDWGTGSLVYLQRA
jgi:hypothetical protein